MKTVRLVILLLFGLLLVGLNACKKSPTEPAPEPINEAEVLVKYLEESGDYINSPAYPSNVSAADVRTMMLANPAKQYIIDFRAPADFTAGRIEGAVNVPLAGLLDHLRSINTAAYDRIVLVCYSHQVAGYATSLMRLMGYNNVFSLRYGMSSWAARFAEDYWNKNIGNARAAAFVRTPSPPKNPAGALPTLTTGKTTGPEILEARVRALLTAGFGVASITHETLFANLGNYYIVAWWPMSHFLDPGHIPGSIQYTAREDLKSTTNLRTLPTNRTIAIWCYTGNTSAFVAAYLRVLGYDAKSQLYGANAMIYDLIIAKGLSSWRRDRDIMNYPFITG